MGRFLASILIVAAICSCSGGTDEVRRIGEIKLANVDFELKKGKSLVFMPEGWRTVKKASFEYYDDLGCDVYYPEHYDPKARGGIVLMANGFTKNEEDDIRQLDGAAFKDLDIVKTWAIALAASGMPTVTYDSNEPEQKRGERQKAAISTGKLVGFIEANQELLGVDAERIGILSIGATANRINVSLADEKWANKVECIVYNYPALDPDVIPRTKISTLIIRSGKLGNGVLFAIDDYAEKLKQKGFNVEVRRNVTGGYNYDTGLENDETIDTIKEIIGYFRTNIGK